MNHPTPDARFCRLTWEGPFSYGPEGLGKSLTDRYGPKDARLEDFYQRPCIYIVLGDHPIHGPRTLLYIGRSNNLKQRIGQHDIWLSEEWRVEVFLAIVEEPKLLEDAEKLLLYAHAPVYNAVNVAEPPRLKQALIIWNEGRFWRLYPEVSSGHDWYQKYEQERT